MKNHLYRCAVEKVSCTTGQIKGEVRNKILASAAVQKSFETFLTSSLINGMTNIQGYGKVVGFYPGVRHFINLSKIVERVGLQITNR